jgi:hypothetical protein
MAIGGRVASVAVKPLAGAASAAVDAGVAIERRAVAIVLDSGELERVIGTALDAPRLQSALSTLLSGDGMARLLTDFVEGGAFDALVDALLASDGLWRLLDGVLDRLTEREALWQLVDELASSPAVRAAIAQQGLGFADQVGNEVRVRSRNADDLLERLARRLTGRRPALPPAAEGPTNGSEP